jgi:transcription factor CP2-like protein
LLSRFQYILNAPTSIATKLGEPSLTYINQGQSYELKIKKLGDLSQHYRKKWLRSTLRICFHERRLQYIENEQIAEWARTHPNERILEVDMPLRLAIFFF